MVLAEKLKLLRVLEGSLRGVNRALSKAEIARLIHDELGETISTAYLSQLESGKRLHMTEKTRDLLSRFYRIHPGYLVSDPEGFRTDLLAMRDAEVRLDESLLGAAQSVADDDPMLSKALREIIDHDRTRSLLLVAARLARHPQLLSKLESAFAIETPAPRAGKDPLEEEPT
jgi:hypothetical protein